MRVPLAVRNLLAELEKRDTPERFIRATEAIERLFELALKRLDDGTIFVSTGDIPAMWLRDSTWQLRPMLAACDGSGEVEEIIGAVSRRQAEYVLIDPYANAFNEGPNGKGWHKDFKDQNPWVFERKYELDSLAAFIDLAVRLYRITGFDAHLDERFWQAAALAVSIIKKSRRTSATAIGLCGALPCSRLLEPSRIRCPTRQRRAELVGFSPQRRRLRSAVPDSGERSRRRRVGSAGRGRIRV